MKLLIKSGFDVNNPSGHLHTCAVFGWPEMMKELLEAGADPNKNNLTETKCTPLFHAVVGVNWEVIELLAGVTDLSLKNGLGFSVLHEICRHGNNPLGKQAMEKLIQLGADLDIRSSSEGHTPLC